MSESILFAFPAELVLSILELLTFRDLLVCKQVCRSFRTAIEHTASLQYTIDLAASGQQDGPCSAVGPAARRDALKAHQAAWDKLQWRHEQCIPMLHGGLWELYGGVLAQSSPEGALNFRRLPSQLRSIEEKEWALDSSNFNFTIRDFGLDPAQDLLVLIENPRWSGSNADHLYRFHLRSLSTGERHPLALKGPVFSHVQVDRDQQVSYAIQISGDNVGVFVYANMESENELLVWNWKTGEVKINITGDLMRAFSFFSERYVIICLLVIARAEDEIEPVLLVLNFEEERPVRRSVDEVSCAFLFRYPRLDDFTDLVAFDLRSDPAPSWAPESDLKVPFQVAKENRIFVVSLWVQVAGVMQNISHFVPLATLQTLLGPLEAERIGGAFDWEEWGPTGTRMLKPLQGPSNVWVCYVYGSKYIMPEARHDTPGEEFFALVYDFNQLGLRRGILERHDIEGGKMEGEREGAVSGRKEDLQHEGGKEHSDGTKRREMEEESKYVIEENIFKAGEIFEHEVRTSLGYRVRRFGIRTPSPHRCEVLCSEDNLIVVDTHVLRREYRILTF